MSGMNWDDPPSRRSHGPRFPHFADLTHDGLKRYAAAVVPQALYRPAAGSALILYNQTAWIVTHLSGMEHPSGPATERS
jgi:hypothetical protein